MLDMAGRITEFFDVFAACNIQYTPDRLSWNADKEIGFCEAPQRFQCTWRIRYMLKNFAADNQFAGGFLRCQVEQRPLVKQRRIALCGTCGIGLLDAHRFKITSSHIPAAIT